jgi:hypothetical protein
VYHYQAAAAAAIVSSTAVVPITTAQQQQQQQGEGGASSSCSRCARQQGRNLHSSSSTGASSSRGCRRLRRRPQAESRPLCGVPAAACGGVAGCRPCRQQQQLQQGGFSCRCQELLVVLRQFAPAGRRFSSWQVAGCKQGSRVKDRDGSISCCNSCAELVIATEPCGFCRQGGVSCRLAGAGGDSRQGEVVCVNRVSLEII